MLLGLAFLANFWIFPSYSTFEDGIFHMNSGLSSLHLLSSDHLSIASNILGEISEVDSHLNNTAYCKSSNSTDLIFNIRRAVASFDNALSQVPDALNSLENALEPEYGILWVGANNLTLTLVASVFSFFFIVVLLLALFAILPCCQQVNQMRGLTVLVQIMLLVLTVTCSLEMISLVSSTTSPFLDVYPCVYTMT